MLSLHTAASSRSASPSLEADVNLASGQCLLTTAALTVVQEEDETAELLATT